MDVVEKFDYYDLIKQFEERLHKLTKSLHYEVFAAKCCSESLNEVVE